MSAGESDDDRLDREAPTLSERSSNDTLLDEDGPPDWLAALPRAHARAAERTMPHVALVFSVLAVLVASELQDEELGDAHEGIVRHFERSSARWPVYGKLASTAFWIVINQVRELVADLADDIGGGRRKRTRAREERPSTRSLSPKPVVSSDPREVHAERPFAVYGRWVY
ncbi:hypothetical protein [Chondromyces crocatus]|uniref:Uncharacterized protein n=1 Tax=Chondromyces crocatus TaxID=52 RepID=A0A0K1ERK6_CHOCO|nr:hypothetical protein [Chondromyces crocatus]AKT43248.1 uncharacterized protein CMC5_074790 [Chondromyces crocatus]